MALGKSVIAALFCHMRREHQPAIIMCPANLKLQWAEYWKEWVGRPVKILDGQKGYPLEQDISYVVNWDVLAFTKTETKYHKKYGVLQPKKVKVVQPNSWFHFIKRAGFKTSIGDEIQFCNNIESMRGKALKEIAESIPNFIPLSGTPIKTKPSQFWLPLHLVDKDRFPKLKRFQDKYCNIEANGYGEHEQPGCKDPKALHRAVKNVMIRYRKADVLKELPGKTRVVVPMEIDQAAWNKEIAIWKEEHKDIDRTKAFELQNAIKSLMSSAFAVKKKSVIEWIDNYKEINPGKKLVIFSWHRAVVEYIHECYKKESVMYYGGMSNKKKQAAFKRFLEDPECLFFDANIQSGGTGLDGMQHICDTCCFTEISRSPMESDQAEDRLLRPGQEHNVGSFFLPAAGTVDMDIMESWDIKREMVDQIVEGKEVSDDNDLLLNLFNKYAGAPQKPEGGMF